MKTLSCLLLYLGAGRDFSLGVSSELVSAGSPATIPVSFLEDGVALEVIESATLELVLPQRSLPSGAIIRRDARLSITDTDGENSSIALGGVNRCILLFTDL